MKKNRSKQRAIKKKKEKEKEIVMKYFRSIIKNKYKDTLDVNKKGIPVLKGTDFPLSAYFLFTYFVECTDEHLSSLFHLKMEKEQSDKTRVAAFFFHNDVLEFLFKEEIEKYYEQLYAKEMFGY